MKGTTWQRCTSCNRKVNGADARKRHKASGCKGTTATWAIKADLGRDADGKRRQVVRAGFTSEAEAVRKLRELLTKVDGGRYVEPTKTTLADYLAEWLAATAPPKVAEATWSKRKDLLRRVTDRIGTTPLHDVNGATLDQLYASLARDGRADGTPLAPSTVHDTHRTLHKAFADAVRWQQLDRNPCHQAEPPRADQVAADARAARQSWSAAELRRFLAGTAEHRHHAAFYVAATTGLRRSELLGLRWQDVDLDAGSLRVVQKLVRGRDRYELVRAPKSAAGARTVALDGATMKVLRDHRRDQAAHRLAYQHQYRNHDLVFAALDGAPLSPPALTKAFRRAVSKVDVPAIRWHDLRHTHATLLLTSNTPVKVVAERLGHASPVVTLTTYAHVLPGQQAGAAAAFGALVAGSDV